MVPRQSQSYMYISNEEGVVVTQGTPQWYPGNLNPICTLVMQKGSLSPRVLPNVPSQSQFYARLCTMNVWEVRWVMTPSAKLGAVLQEILTWSPW